MIFKHIVPKGTWARFDRTKKEDFAARNRRLPLSERLRPLLGATDEMRLRFIDAAESGLEAE
jgi:hypothetical protein